MAPSLYRSGLGHKPKGEAAKALDNRNAKEVRTVEDVGPHAYALPLHSARRLMGRYLSNFEAQE